MSVDVLYQPHPDLTLPFFLLCLIHLNWQYRLLGNTKHFGALVLSQGRAWINKIEINKNKSE